MPFAIKRDRSKKQCFINTSSFPFQIFLPFIAFSIPTADIPISIRLLLEREKDFHFCLSHRYSLPRQKVVKNVDWEKKRNAKNNNGGEDVNLSTFVSFCFDELFSWLHSVPLDSPISFLFCILFFTLHSILKPRFSIWTYLEFKLFAEPRKKRKKRQVKCQSYVPSSQSASNLKSIRGNIGVPFVHRLNQNCKIETSSLNTIFFFSSVAVFNSK